MKRSESWLNRQKVWRHNGFFGSVAMTRAQMLAIIKSDTAIGEAKIIAGEIVKLCDQLKEALETRRK